jgi:hypothetical protein
MATGQRYGRLVAVRVDPGDPLKWLCRCDCGTTKFVRVTHVRAGRTQSCGCLKLQRSIESHTTHGMVDAPEYTVWATMFQRCTNPNHDKFATYGGRGISVCERWFFFENFFADMGQRPTPLHSIDRKDNDGNYEPENCRWATQKEQARNRRTSRMLNFQGRDMTLAEVAEISGVNYDLLKKRTKMGWDAERAVMTPSRVRNIRRSFR